MSDLADLLDAVLRIERRMGTLETRVTNMLRPGPVVERDHEKGVRINLGTGADGKPVLSDWIKPSDASGVTSYLPREGEQGLLIAANGDQQQGIYVALTHSDAKKDPAPDGDTTVHFNRDGQNHRVKNGAVTDQADRMHRRFVGEDPGEGNLAHMLNKQLAGLRAAVTQNTHNIAGLHDATSKLRQVLQPRNPEVAALIPLLNGDASSLEAAVEGMTGKFQGYLGSAVQMAVAKLTNGFLDNLTGIITGALNGRIGGLVGQLAGIVQGGGLDAAAQAAASTLVDEVQGLAAGATSGVAAEIEGRLDQIQDLLAGTPAAGALADLRGQITGALGYVAQVMGGLGDMLDGQQKLVKGITQSYKLGAQ